MPGNVHRVHNVTSQVTKGIECGRLWLYPCGFPGGLLGILSARIMRSYSRCFFSACLFIAKAEPSIIPREEMRI